jgi:hypothetical protein
MRDYFLSVKLKIPDVIVELCECDFHDAKLIQSIRRISEIPVCQQKRLFAASGNKKAAQLSGF